MILARRIRNPFLSRAFQRTLGSLARTAVRTGSTVVARALRAAPAAPRRSPILRSKPRAGAPLLTGMAVGTAGARRYQLYQPTGVRRAERLPLVVMLHGCAQDAQALATSSRMNRVAAQERFLVLYPQQDRLSNVQGCWNWYDTRSGRAQREAQSIWAVIDQVCRTQPVDPLRIVLAGLSAGAAMAALLATLQPERFRVLVMHSGVGPGVVQSQAGALSAMRGRRLAVAAPRYPALVAGVNSKSSTPHTALSAAGLAVPPADLPALLVIHGSADHVVAPVNGAEAARHWAARMGAHATASRILQRGARYPMTVTDYRRQGRVVVTHCAVSGLGHAWSGGAAGHAYSDPKGPDASHMVWAFAARQFALDRAAPQIAGSVA